MKTSSGLMIIFFLITLFSNFHCINEPSGSEFYILEGIITEAETGKPIEKVLVLSGLTSRPEDTRISTHTDKRGYFSLSIKSGAGLYFLYSEREGYWHYMLYIDIGKEPLERLDIHLISEDRCPNDNWGFQPLENCYGFTDLNPSWSPDGRYIAYLASDMKRGSIPGMYVYDLQQNTERLIIDWVEDMSSQAWSPDGEWLTFSMGKQIYKIRTDGRSLTQLTANPEREYFYPAWSPDGMWIMYEDRTPVPHYDTNKPDSVLQRGAWFMKYNGGDKYWPGYKGGYPIWNPDGKNILTVRGTWPHETGIVFLIYSLSTTAIDTLTVRHNSINMTPNFSPDGNQIVFYSSHDNEEDIDIWLIKSDGTRLQRLTTNGGAQPAWSPDGAIIAYANIDLFEGKGKIWLMNPDGTNRRPMRR